MKGGFELATLESQVEHSTTEPKPLFEPNEVNIRNIFYAEKMNTNLVSFRELTDNNKIISKGM